MASVVMHCATPAVTGTFVQLAIGVGEPASSVAVKLTAPVGMMVPVFGVTVAVKVSGVSTVAGLPEVTRVIPGVPGLTVSVPVPVSGLLLVSPAKLATIL